MYPHLCHDLTVVKKLVLLTSYFGALPVVIVLLIFYLLYTIHAKPSHTASSGLSPSLSFKALPKDRINSETQITQEDARIAVLREFFKKHRSPLREYAQNIVEVADKYSMDYRLIPAIAMQESNACRKIPKNSFNCWGFGIYGGNVRRFSDYGEGIEIVTKTLAREYRDKGYRDPVQIMAKYTPSSNGSWAKSVIYFMDSLKTSL